MTLHSHGDRSREGEVRAVTDYPPRTVQCQAEIAVVIRRLTHFGGSNEVAGTLRSIRPGFCGITPPYAVATIFHVASRLRRRSGGVWVRRADCLGRRGCGRDRRRHFRPPRCDDRRYGLRDRYRYSDGRRQDRVRQGHRAGPGHAHGLPGHFPPARRTRSPLHIALCSLPTPSARSG